MRQFALIRHLKLHNANAISSPYSIGFPAMTAWLGAVHALQRQLQQQAFFANVQLSSIAVSCHSLDVQTHKGAGDYVHSIIGTANPLTKQGERSAFIEEARCHLEVSLLIEFSGVSADHLDAFTLAIEHCVQRMKFASGDVLSCRGVECLSVNEDEPSSIKKICNKLMLGHVLVERRDFVANKMQAGQDALDALLDYLKITQQSSKDDHGNLSWRNSRLTKGWLVPIAVGFQGISALGVAQQQRDANTPHRFAESVVTLGEFVMPYRIEDLDDMLWHYHVDPEKDLYLCRTGVQTV
jgi:CRISPR-associated protein Csy2